MYYLGIDIGSVSTDFVILNKELEVVDHLYLSTKGLPMKAVQEGLKLLKGKYLDEAIKAVGTTGSGRKIIGTVVGADSVKNEITAHAVAALHINPYVKTILEIGGQDSKIIILKDGIVTDFAMNTVCAAGTGSFLDRQAHRLGIPIQDFGAYALKANHIVRIAGRCAVFAESDMIHKQQMGYDTPSIVKGLCDALVRNYLSNIAKGKEIVGPIFFQGGVAANIGIRKAFEEALAQEVIVPEHYNVMGAIGAAVLAKEEVERSKGVTQFKGFDLEAAHLSTRGFECEGCSNRCEVVAIEENGVIIGYYGDRCGKWLHKIKKTS
ncbi:MAG: 2-hydroxyglutaryl-CoA dehydratase [Firmicutes bacterium HGW-Firmicutes-1]|jgi:predicted CoA-substrate-specific enzyme activase|nr:MAG: 2-hydroxyglutaryl-CoA dehydratase [Firmicutes bacterium HGW-Firmicutes-1]